MKRLLFACAIAILAVSVAPALRGQDGGFGGGFGGDSVDITGMLGNRGGRGDFGNNGRGGFQMPDSKVLYGDIQSALKKGKTPLQKAQEKPVQNLLDLEIVNLSDKIQIMRNSNNNNNNNGNFNNGGFNDRGGGNFPPGGGNFPPGGFPPGGDNFPRRGEGGGFPPGGDQGGNTNSMATALNVQIETLSDLKNDDFIENKLPAFLSPEQMALVKKTKAEDKSNGTCLGGMLDRASNPLQNNNNNNRGNNNNNNNRGNNNNFSLNNNSTHKANGQAFCMTAESTAAARLEPIRKVLAAGNLPLANDKEAIAEIFMKSQIKDLDDALRSTLTASFSGNRGGGNNPFSSRSSNPQAVIQATTDEIHKKVQDMLEPPQAETLKKWHYEQMFSRSGVESLISVEAMQQTPLSDAQIARVSAAWTELRSQMQAAAKSAKKNISDKELDSATMEKVVEMLDPPQVASYQAAKKYLPQSSGK